MNTRQKGSWGEAQAEAFLCAAGYTIAARGYHCRYGEIDLIATRGDVVVFVEVKLRKNRGFSHAWEAVTPQKQEKLRKTASLWLAEQASTWNGRFDVIEVYTDRVEIVHIEDAFR